MSLLFGRGSHEADRRRLDGAEAFEWYKGQESVPGMEHRFDGTSVPARPEDLAMKGMMAKMGGPSLRPAEAKPTSRINAPPRALGSSSPTRNQSRNIFFPSATTNAAEATAPKPKTFPPKQSLSKILVGSGMREHEDTSSMAPEPASSRLGASFGVGLEACQAEEQDDEAHWTTVFGFPPLEVDNVIDYFRRLGPIEEIRKVDQQSDARAPFATFVQGANRTDVPAGPTWIHLRWQDLVDAEKALRKEGTILRAYRDHAAAFYPQETDRPMAFRGRLEGAGGAATGRKGQADDLLAMDYMIGVMSYKKAKRVLGTEHETIYWQSPIRKRRPQHQQPLTSSSGGVLRPALVTEGGGTRLFRSQVHGPPSGSTSVLQQAPKASLLDNILAYFF